MLNILKAIGGAIGSFFLDLVKCLGWIMIISLLIIVFALLYYFANLSF